MPLKDLLDIDSVYVGLRVATVARLFSRIATALAMPHGFDEETIQTALLAREQLGSTALGHGVALPHAAIPGLPRGAACCMRLDRRLPMGAPDGEPVDLVFALVVPDSFTDQKLLLLAELAERLGSASRRQALRSAPDAQALHQELLRS